MPLPRPAAGTGRWWAIGIAGCTLAVVLISWWGLRTASERITATTVGYKVVDDSTVRITFDVTRPSQLTVRCTLRALDGRFTVVGSADVLIPPSADPTVGRVETIRTVSRAVTGLVQDCVRI